MSIELHINEAGHLALIDATGAKHENVRPLRLFPLTDPEHWIAIQDAKGHELACIEDPAVLPEPYRQALQAALAKRVFVPVIHAIHHITRANNGYDWHVATDRGLTTFRIETDESIQTLGGTRLVIIDNHNTRYLIPDLRALDRDSRRKLERYY